MRDFRIGVVAGCAFLVVELLARLVAGVPSVPELLQDRLVVLAPGPVFSFVLDRLYYLGKPLFFTGMLVLQLVLAGVGGVVVARWRRPAALAAILWLLTGFVVFPIFGRGVFANQVSVAVATLIAFGAYALALVYYGGAPMGSAIRTTAESAETTGNPLGGPANPERRLLLGGGVSLLATIVLGREVIGALPTVTSNAATTTSNPATPSPTSGIAAASSTPLPAGVTPISDFYEVSKNLVDPVVSAKSWHLTVDGLVDHPLSLTYEQILAQPSVVAYRTLECISNPVGGNLISNGRWRGTRMADLLNQAKIQSGADVVNFTGVDGYTESMPLAKALDPTTLLAYHLDDQPLPAKHGFPLRVLGTGTYGMKNPKWLRRMEVAKTASTGFWVQQGWSKTAIVQTMSEFTEPPQGHQAKVGPVAVKGVAFSGARGIRQVEVSTDSGKTWQAAHLESSLGRFTWVIWDFPWHPTKPGNYSLVVRATDGTGQVQTSRTMDTFPDGATGYDQINVTLTS